MSSREGWHTTMVLRWRTVMPHYPQRLFALAWFTQVCELASVMDLAPRLVQAIRAGLQASRGLRKNGVVTRVAQEPDVGSVHAQVCGGWLGTRLSHASGSMEQFVVESACAERG